MTRRIRSWLLVGIALAMLVGCAATDAGQVSVDESGSDAKERFVAVMREHEPPVMAWVSAEQSCNQSCATDGAQALDRYQQLREMARAFQIDLNVAEPAPEELKDLVGRTEVSVRRLRSDLNRYIECMQAASSSESCRDAKAAADETWAELPQLFRAWRAYA